MSAHTPHPWEIRDEGCPAIFGKGDLLVCMVEGTDGDARLIAAAPDLADELERLVGLIQDAGWHHEITENSVEILLKIKAEGRV